MPQQFMFKFTQFSPYFAFNCTNFWVSRQESVKFLYNLHNTYILFLFFLNIFSNNWNHFNFLLYKSKVSQATLTHSIFCLPGNSLVSKKCLIDPFYSL